MYRERLHEMQKEFLMKVASDFDFPNFLRTLRKTCGMSQKKLADDIAISPYRLMYLETGKFERMPDEHELIIIGEYFGVQAKVLKNKARQFLKLKHSQ